MLLLPLLPAPAAPPPPPRRPNILLLMPDQWRWDWDGTAHPHTGKLPPLSLPNIDGLRSAGTAFPRGAAVPAVVCAPSRSCMASLREYDEAGTATNGIPGARFERYQPAGGVNAPAEAAGGTGTQELRTAKRSIFL